MKASTAQHAIVALLTWSDKVLVIQRGPGTIFPGYWAPPSGRIEPGESHEDAVVREIHEELGIDALPLAKVWECPTDDGEFILHWWTATLSSRELHPDPDEVADAAWVTADEFLVLEPTFRGDREFFARVWPSIIEGSDVSP